MDREKVIKGLECCTFILGKRKCSECPYQKDNGCYQLQDDFHALLKDQDAVEPEVEVLNEIDRLYRCPRCHKHFFYEKQKYCDQCGQAVKWE